MKEPMTAVEIEQARLDEAAAKTARLRAAREAAGVVPHKAESKESKTAWIDDVRDCIRDHGERRFTMSDLEEYFDVLADKHPRSNTVESSVRHALQKLRDKGEVCFVDDQGSYIYLPFEK